MNSMANKDQGILRVHDTIEISISIDLYLLNNKIIRKTL